MPHDALPLTAVAGMATRMLLILVPVLSVVATAFKSSCPVRIRPK
jgi:hypothetical protein